MRRLHVILITVALLLMISVSACGTPAAQTPVQSAQRPAQPASVPQPTQPPEPTPAPEATTASEAPEPEFAAFDPSNFDRSTQIDNKWMPMKPGTRWVYEGTAVEDSGSLKRRIEFTVSDVTKEIDGVRTVVAWIVDYNDGEAVEKEIAFYAQDNDGKVWYLGEHPEEYKGGKFVKAPTWIAGVKDAKAGIKMMTEPQPGMPKVYQGWAPAVGWSDYGQLERMGQKTCVPVKCYDDALVIAESSLGETDAFQLKYYARGVGNIGVSWRGADATQEELGLVKYEQLSPEALAEVRAQVLETEKHAYEVSKDVYGRTSPAE